MKYEPLKDKKQKLKKNRSSSKDKNQFHQGFEKGVDDSFDIFDSYVGYYKRYKNNVKLLMNEQKNVWSRWVKYYESQPRVDTSNYLHKYNDWLFDYIFSDVNEESETFLTM